MTREVGLKNLFKLVGWKLRFDVDLQRASQEPTIKLLVFSFIVAQATVTCFCICGACSLFGELHSQASSTFELSAQS